MRPSRGGLSSPTRRSGRPSVRADSCARVSLVAPGGQGPWYSEGRSAGE